MRINDRRFHVFTPVSDEIRAERLLVELANRAFSMWDGRHETRRYEQRNREKFPDAFGNRPGAFIERCTPEERELLTKLVSSQDMLMPDWFHYLGEAAEYPERSFGPGGPFGLPKSPPTVFKLGPFKS